MSRAIATVALLACGLVGARCAAAPGEEPRKLGTYAAQVELAFTPDGHRLVVTMRGGAAALVDVETGRRTARYSTGDAAPAQDEPAAPPDGQEAPAEPEPTPPGPTLSESAVAVSRDGARVAVGTLEGRVRIFEAKTGATVISIEAQGPVTSLAFSADGKALVTGGGKPHSLETGEVEAAAATAHVFDAATGAQVLAVDAQGENTGTAVAASPAGPIAAVARADGKLELLNLAETKRHSVDLGAPSLAVAFSADGALVVAMGGADGAAATLVDVASGRVLRTLSRGNDPATPDGALAFSPDGKVIARTHPGVARVFLHAVDTGKILRAFDLPSPCASMAYAPDGATIAVGLRSGDVLLVRNPLLAR